MNRGRPPAPEEKPPGKAPAERNVTANRTGNRQDFISPACPQEYVLYFIVPAEPKLEPPVSASTSISHSIDTARRILFLRINREPSLAEAEKALLAAFQDPLYGQGFYCLVDRTRIGPPTTQYVHGLTGIIHRHREIFTPARVAVVVSSPATYGMFRMLQALTHDVHCESNIFVDEAEAEQWLCRPQNEPLEIG